MNILFFFLFFIQLTFAQYREIPNTFNEKKINENKMKGLPEDYGLYKRFEFRVEESENFNIHFEEFKKEIKQIVIIEEITFDDKKRNVSILCTLKNSTDFLLKLKTLLHQKNYKLRKYKEQILEKITAQ